jgi:hypothetical protein
LHLNLDFFAFRPLGHGSATKQNQDHSRCACDAAGRRVVAVARFGSCHPQTRREFTVVAEILRTAEAAPLSLCRDPLLVLSKTAPATPCPDDQLILHTIIIIIIIIIIVVITSHTLSLIKVTVEDLLEEHGAGPLTDLLVSLEMDGNSDADEEDASSASFSPRGVNTGALLLRHRYTILCSATSFFFLILPDYFLL